MEIQLSSGQGPTECELAVAKLLEALLQEFPASTVVAKTLGSRPGTYRSVRIQSEADLSFLEGSVQWVCQSPYRRGHKRKNWFVDVSPCQKVAKNEYDPNVVRLETFRCGGKGGQHVNKVETGVRVIHLPTGLAASSTEARSQHMNKSIALNRLCDMLAQQNEEGAAYAKALDRLEHTRIERGNPTRVYEGASFARIR